MFLHLNPLYFILNNRWPVTFKSTNMSVQLSKNLTKNCILCRLEGHILNANGIFLEPVHHLTLWKSSRISYSLLLKIPSSSSVSPLWDKRILAVNWSFLKNPLKFKLVHCIKQVMCSFPQSRSQLFCVT